MKKISIIIFLVVAHYTFSQEVFESKKIKIGKYSYNLNLSENYFLYEDNIHVINFDIALGSKHQLLGTKMTYRKPNSSSNYDVLIDETIPKDKKSTFKDGVILSIGEIEIDYKKHIIIVSEKTVYKDNQEEPEIKISKFKQMKNGFFKLVKITEINNGKETIILNKE